MAWAVQHPAEQAEVCLVFKGRKGTGKGTLGRALRQVFGQHAAHISSSKHLTGEFNFHLRDACLLFADECLWPGDRAAIGSLNRLITEPTLQIEAKHRNLVETPNYLHIVMASNENWVVPSGECERRYVLCEVPDSQIQSREWFAPLYAQMDAGGYAAMLYDLLHHDLGDWHPRDLPTDTGLFEQQRLSLAPLDNWWCELLERGTLAGSDPEQPNCARSGKWQQGTQDKNDAWHFVTRPGLLDDARNIEPRLRYHIGDNQLGDHFKKQGCSNEHRVLAGERLDVPCPARATAGMGGTFPRLALAQPGNYRMAGGGGVKRGQSWWPCVACVGWGACVGG